MPTGGQLIELCVVMRKLLQMPVGGQLRELCVATDASWRATHKVMRSDAQIMADANRRAV